ncbi:molybdopterin converting factor subunit 1 [Pseudomonas sp. PS01297]|uniref:molybdopterin converting factor subunit 1 n=1 Tax=Pseudomonas sp. PS01297 TaxID=2991433 RepID=UPI00249A6A4D|nr:molybdopterin converting factor subunit 1 [Pseudomonas sp. PS01297]
MTLLVQFFARYREALGLDKVSVEGQFTSVDQLRQHLLQQGDAWQFLADTNLMCARNEELCKLDESLSDGDIVAFFPPVTGG